MLRGAMLRLFVLLSCCVTATAQNVRVATFQADVTPPIEPAQEVLVDFLDARPTTMRALMDGPLPTFDDPAPAPVPVPVPAASPPPALLPEVLQSRPQDYLVNVILEGRPGTAMPGWGALLSDEEARWMTERLLEGDLDRKTHQ